MHKYERFIVYPLLIVALFYSMAGEQINTTAQKVYDEIIAENITIVNDEGNKMIELKSKEKEVITDEKVEFGEIKTYKDNNSLLTKLGTSGGTKLNGEVNTYNNDGKQTTSMKSTTMGGIISSYCSEEKPRLVLRAYNKGGDIDIRNKNNNYDIRLSSTPDDKGIINIRNKHNNDVITLGQTVPDEDGESGNHGLINIYDKYGEDFRSYTYSLK